MNIPRTFLLSFTLTLTGVWPAPVRTQEIAPVKVVSGGEFPAVARGPNGHLHIVYGANDGRIFHRSYDLSSGILEPQENTGALYIDDSKARPAVVVDSRGWVHVSGSTYSFKSSGSWETISTAVSRDTALAVDSRDNIYIITRGTNQSEFNGPGYIQITKRVSGASSFTPLTNVDHILPGRNNHVYGAIAVSPIDDSLHVVYRHGAPLEHAYRQSTGARLTDGSIDVIGTWTIAEGVSGDGNEGPAVTVDGNGVVYSIGGTGTVHRRSAAAGSWSSEGPVVDGGERHGPRLVSDVANTIYATAWGGKYNVRRSGSWIGQRAVPSLSGKGIGHVGIAPADGEFCHVVWEESDAPSALSGGGLADLVLATIDRSGEVGSGTGGTGTTPKTLGNLGVFRKWHKVEVTLRGPTSAGISVASSPNPFTSMKVDVTFRGPPGAVTVPGFYDGDGDGGTSGNVWKVRFSANATGSWTFETSSSVPELDRYVGSFSVTEPAANAAAFLKSGRLEFVGGHYLRFADGDYWVKAGIDDPENFLGEPFGDWSGKLAAVDFLSARGVNSVYLITNNTGGGDGKDTWPWLGGTQAAAQQNSSRYDVAKLREWESFFAHCQTRGLVLHIVLDDDSAWDGYDHDLYYREMVARFGHHPALIWNIGEEADEIYSTNEQIQLANRLRAIDPFGHPITVHRKNRWPFLGNTAFDLTSIQTDGLATFTATSLVGLNAMVIDHRNRSVESGHAIPIFVDETPRITQVNDATRRLMREYVLYPILLGGGNYELHYADDFGGGSLTIQAMAPVWDDMAHARHLVEGLPFHEMAPGNEMLSVRDRNYCLAAPGTAYGIYLGAGGAVDLDLRGVTGSLKVVWHNVTTGATQNGGAIAGGNWRGLGTPPFSGDVAVSVTKSTGGSGAVPLPPTNLIIE